jgi:hypothetical protein
MPSMDTHECEASQVLGLGPVYEIERRIGC